MFYYDETSKTGLRWKINYGWTGTYFINKIHSEVGNLNDKDGYYKVNVDKQKYYVHRIIWIMLRGPIPEGLVINHIDNNRSKSFISNLEICTIPENARRALQHTSSRTIITNTSGITGVSCREDRNGNVRWVAHWTENFKLKTKSFSCNIYGDYAKIIAYNYRKDQINRLKEEGYGYP